MATSKPAQTEPKPASQRRVARKAPAAKAPAVKAAVAVAAKPSPAAKRPKPRTKPVRDSFTMPVADFALIHGLKERALAFRRPAKKSELLRAGLHALQAMDDTRLHAALEALVPLKPGRPKKGA